jgi:hypothetical protein
LAFSSLKAKELYPAPQKQKDSQANAPLVAFLF